MLPGDLSRNGHWDKKGSLTVELLCGLTLGHLCLLQAWELAAGGSPRLFRLDESLGHSTLGPLIMLTCGLAMLGTASLHRFRTCGSVVGASSWTALLLVGTLSLCRLVIYGFLNRFHLVASVPGAKMVFVALIIAILLGLLYFIGMIKWVKGSKGVLAAMSPLLLVLWWSSGIQYLDHPKGQAPVAKVAATPRKPLWVLVFDELDGKTILDGAQGQGQGAEFAQWKTFSLFCTHAYPPAGATLWSLPALLQGRQVLDTPSDMNYIKTEAHLAAIAKARNWNWGDNLFQDRAHMGQSCDLIGWGEFPYRPFYEKSVSNFWFLTEQFKSDPLDAPPTFFEMARIILVEAVVGPFRAAKSNPAKAHTRVVETLRIVLERVLTRGPADLTWIHYPIPHWPALRDGGTYGENLLAAEHELAAFREGLQRHGYWDESTVIVMADHWLRKPGPGLPEHYDAFLRGFEDRWQSRDHRVPFFIKLPHQSHGHLHGKEFNTIVLRKLLTAMANGKLPNPEAISAWLDANTPYGESPTTVALP